MTITVLCGGCSVNGYGFIAAEVFEGDGSQVVQVHNVGLDLRTRAESSGLTLGYARRVYVFSKNTRPLPTVGWHFLMVKLPETRSVLQYHEAFGADLSTGDDSFSATLGYRSRALLAQIPNQVSLYRELSFSPKRLSATRLRTCERIEECSSLMFAWEP